MGSKEERRSYNTHDLSCVQSGFDASFDKAGPGPGPGSCSRSSAIVGIAGSGTILLSLFVAGLHAKYEA